MNRYKSMYICLIGGHLNNYHSHSNEQSGIMKTTLISYFVLGCLSMTGVAQNQIGFNPPPGCGSTTKRAPPTRDGNKYCESFVCRKNSDGKQDSVEKQCAKACPNFRSTDANKKVSSVTCFYSGKWHAIGDGRKEVSEKDINKGGKRVKCVVNI